LECACLGGPDDRSNVAYEPWGEARRKNQLERHWCEEYCHVGTESFRRDAQRFFSSGAWRNYLNNYED
jgi:hypothetical protein